MRLNVVGGTMIALLLVAFVVAYSTLFHGLSDTAGAGRASRRANPGDHSARA
jgi:hypothetical protein